MEKCKEYWRPVENYEGLYEVSNYGCVKALAKTWASGKNNCTIRQQEEKILCLSVDREGYNTITLYKNGGCKTFKVHKIEMNAFIPNPNNYPCINHRDENKLNNFIWVNDNGTVDLEKSNLEWCTAKYNTNYGTAIQRRAAKKSKPVLQYTLEDEFVKEWPSTAEIEKQLGYLNSNISVCCNGRKNRISAYGFKWKYA